MSTHGGRPATEPRARPQLCVAYDIGAFSPLDLHDSLAELCDIVWLADLGDPGLGPMGRLLGRLGTVVDTEGRPPDEAVDLLTGIHLDGVVAYNDRELPLAAAVAAALGLPGNPAKVVERLNDKLAQREALAAAGIPSPDHRLIPAVADAAKAEAIVEDMAFPIVCKPLRGDSSRDVVLVDGPAAVAVLVENLGASGRPREAFLAEDYLHGRSGPGPSPFGDYVSVEMIVEGGRPLPLAVTGKFALAPPFRETGNFMPHLLDEADARQVLALAVAAAEALGVRTGALHTEVKLTPDGPRIIEVNGRVGGGGIDTLFQRRHGRSLTELAARVALGLAVGGPTVSVPTPAGPFVYEYFVQPPVRATRLVSMGSAEGLIGVAGAETVTAHHAPGDPVDLREGSQGYVLRVGGTAPDRNTLAAVPTAIESSAGLEYDVL